MERADASSFGACRRLCLRRQDLFQLVQDRLCDHWHALERAKVFRPAGQVSRAIIRIIKSGSAKHIRCAIYTRVSTDQGLEQDFNSLDAQYEASQAYIRSQAHAGWTLLRTNYDDGGFSGGNTERPALQRVFRGEILKGEQPAILDRDLFDAVQAKLDRQAQSQTSRQSSSEALLMGRIFDDAGNRMTPTHARKRGVKYRYYLSSALLNGEAERTGAVLRLPAAALEAVVIRSVRQHLKSPAAMNDRSLIETHIARVEVDPQRLIIRLAQGEQAANEPAGPLNTLSVPWQKTAATRRREILLPEGVAPQNARRIRSENRTTLLALPADAAGLKNSSSNSTSTTETIAKREGCTTRKVNMTISLAFLAPDLVQAAIDGTLPHGMGVVRLADLPTEWSQQHRMLGLPRS